MTRRLLIANRGEITVRIIRTCKEMNIKTVAVYSTADKEALHIQLADYAVCIGGPRANGSYLSMKNILNAACITACDAIHPGFGFLGESAKFVRLVLQCSLIFVGPSPDVIEQTGDKNNARRCMMETGVPVIPGSKDLLGTIQDAATIAEKIGYPVLIKASSGEGGHGMRRADYAEEPADAFDTAEAEARVDFGGDTIYMEKFIAGPKHIEVQLMAGKHGSIVHLYGYNCSCQRRNQKLLEETPCHMLEEDVREHLLRDAVCAAESVSCDSVGTIEFLLDARGEYYFMEVDTRIQVEHTISEEICGTDLVKQQIRIAGGHKLAYRQKNIVCRGHAIEYRINAENIEYNFTPNSGQVSFINFPLGRHVRIESAIYNDYNIPPYYDSMIVEIVTYAGTRLECIRRIRSALEELLIEGVEINIKFQYLLLHHPTFVDGHYNTGSMESFIKELKESGTIIQGT